MGNANKNIYLWTFGYEAILKFILIFFRYFLSERSGLVFTSGCIAGPVGDPELLVPLAGRGLVRDQALQRQKRVRPVRAGKGNATEAVSTQRPSYSGKLQKSFMRSYIFWIIRHLFNLSPFVTLFLMWGINIVIPKKMEF